MADDTLVPPSAPSPPPAADDTATRLAELRAELKRVAPLVKVERVEATADGKAHVKASWERKRVAHVVEPPYTADDAEIAVLSVVIAQHKGG